MSLAAGGGVQRGKGRFLIAQLEVAFVKSKFYLFKMAPLPPSSPGCHPTRMACWGLGPKNAINSGSGRPGEITDKVLSIIHTVPNLARINARLRRRSLSFICRSSGGGQIGPSRGPSQSGSVRRAPPPQRLDRTASVSHAVRT